MPLVLLARGQPGSRLWPDPRCKCNLATSFGSPAQPLSPRRLPLPPRTLAGGSTSNLFSYFSKGDVSLSITMTIISSALSFGTLPLLLWMLAEPFATSDLQIPFLNVVVALLLVVIPVAIGVTVRTNCIRVAWYLEKSATVLGSIFIIVAIVYGSITEADIFLAPATEWVTAFLLCFGGAGIGYGLAIASGLRRYQARTVALETGIQNSTLTIAILTFSFADTAFLGPVLRFPLLYSLVLIVCGVIMSGLFFWLARFDSEDDEHHRRAAELAEASATALESKHKPEVAPKDGAIAHQAESKVGLVESGAASPGGAEA